MVVLSCQWRTCGVRTLSCFTCNSPWCHLFSCYFASCIIEQCFFPVLYFLWISFLTYCNKWYRVPLVDVCCFSLLMSREMTLSEVQVVTVFGFHILNGHFSALLTDVCCYFYTFNWCIVLAGCLCWCLHAWPTVWMTVRLIGGKYVNWFTGCFVGLDNKMPKN